MGKKHGIRAVNGQKKNKRSSRQVVVFTQGCEEDAKRVRKFEHHEKKKPHELPGKKGKKKLPPVASKKNGLGSPKDADQGQRPKKAGRNKKREGGPPKR